MFNSLRTHILNDDALLHGLLQLCKAARVLSPIKYRHMSLLNKDLSGLARVLSGEEIAAMKQEEPSYAQAEHQYDVNGDQSTGILQWYADFSSKFPARARAATKVFALTVSSSSVERAFFKAEQYVHRSAIACFI
jgi:hypothetical protein